MAEQKRRDYSQTVGEKIRLALLRREDQYVKKEQIKIETGLSEITLGYAFRRALRKGWVQKAYSKTRTNKLWDSDIVIEYGIGLSYKIIYKDAWHGLYS